MVKINFKKFCLSFWLCILLISSSVFAQPPPPGPVPPNSAVITANVLKYSIWRPGSLEHNKHPILPRNQTFYSLTLKINTSKPESPELTNNAVPGEVYEAFSSNEFDTELVGKKIEAKVELTGDTSGVRWMISNVSVMDEKLQNKDISQPVSSRIPGYIYYFGGFGVILIFVFLFLFQMYKKFRK